MERAKKAPSYRLHKASGQGIVTIKGRDYYLGRFGSPESYQAYDRTLAEWEGGMLDDDSAFTNELRCVMEFLEENRDSQMVVEAMNLLGWVRGK